MSNKLTELADIIGKTISGAFILGYNQVDDVPIMRIRFTDNTYVDIEASYGGYTAQSFDEYPAFIEICGEPTGLDIGEYRVIEGAE